MKSTFSIFLLLPALLALAACRPAEVPQTQETGSGTSPHPNRVTLTPAQRSAIGVETGPFRTDKVRTKIRANGVLDVPPQNMVSIHAPFGGFLKHTALLPGTKVSRGQVVATVENPAFITMQQEYLEARSQTDYLASEFQRQTALAAENVNARKSLEKATSEYETMKARLAGSKAKLEMLQLDLHRLERGEIVREVPILAPMDFGDFQLASANLMEDYGDAGFGMDQFESAPMDNCFFILSCTHFLVEDIKIS
ncbi:MAG: hypothetical protein RLZZ165_2073, partial [Bacteroidota bacterium]